MRRVPAAQARAYRAACRYVAGSSRNDALGAVSRLHGQGLAVTLDSFGEMVAVSREAERAARDYVELAHHLRDLPEDTWLAIDLSHIGLDISTDFCLRQLSRIVEAMPSEHRIQLGAEDSTRTDRTLDVITRLTAEGAPLTATVQANLRRSPADATRLAAAGVPIRLVKGAYVEPPTRAFAWGAETDVAFIRLAHRLGAADAAFSVATHDAVIREALLAAFDGLPVEMLLGVREDDARALVARGVPVRVYVPFGRDWFRYWMRRLAESRGS